MQMASCGHGLLLVALCVSLVCAAPQRSIPSGDAPVVLTFTLAFTGASSVDDCAQFLKKTLGNNATITVGSSASSSSESYEVTVGLHSTPAYPYDQKLSLDSCKFKRIHSSPNTNVNHVTPTLRLQYDNFDECRTDMYNIVSKHTGVYSSCHVSAQKALVVYSKPNGNQPYLSVDSLAEVAASAISLDLMPASPAMPSPKPFPSHKITFGFHSTSSVLRCASHFLKDTASALPVDVSLHFPYPTGSSRFRYELSVGFHGSLLTRKQGVLFPECAFFGVNAWTEMFGPSTGPYATHLGLLYADEAECSAEKERLTGQQDSLHTGKHDDWTVEDHCRLPTGGGIPYSQHWWEIDAGNPFTLQGEEEVSATAVTVTFSPAHLS
mmetsp:Transcript_435/g.1022  ORF Transcript_435/g.1022 Transcript_435/m.1022 type:complete len:380 (-) Transcript_435:245-1384(-)